MTRSMIHKIDCILAVLYRLFTKDSYFSWHNETVCAKRERPNPWENDRGMRKFQKLSWMDCV
jgi:hypothetical protein